MPGNDIQSTAVRVSAILADYIFMNSDHSKHTDLAKAIKAGEGMQMYKIGGNCAGAFKYRLDMNGIPYVEHKDGKRIYIRRPDKEKVCKLNKETLKEKGSYLHEVAISDMENAIANIPDIKNKKVVSIQRVGKYMAEILKEKCNNISAGFMMGSDSCMRV